MFLFRVCRPHLTAAALALSPLLAPPAVHAATPAVTQAAGKVDARFQAIYQAEWQWRLQQRLAWDEDEPRALQAGLPKTDARTQAARLGEITLNAIVSQGKKFLHGYAERMRQL